MMICWRGRATSGPGRCNPYKEVAAVSIPYYGDELINIAIGIERRGIMFYDVLARSTGDARTREIFQYLSGMEREHIRAFEGMLGAADREEHPETYAGEYGAYLQALADSAVFPDDATTSELVSQAEGDLAAVALGIGAEKDSILFYYEMMELASPREKAMIRKIINEEKSHLRQLTELHKILAA
jgi:rubrerythrin